MFWLLRRWVPWTPAAFVGGLFYGFSPFVLTSLALAHPNFGMLAPVPLIVGCLDELLVRHRRSPVLVGVALGILVVLEFFVAVEVLLTMALFIVLAVVLLAVTTALRAPAELRHHARRAVPGLAAAAVVAAVLLAYPLWSFFDGPAHLAGRAWPNSPPGTVGTTFTGFFDGSLSPGLTLIMHALGGYQGPALPLFSLVGVGIPLVLLAGLVLWRHDRRLWLFGLLAVLAAAMSTGVGVGVGNWGLWRLFVHLPVLENVVPINITAVTDFCVAVMLAIIIEHAFRWTAARVGDGQGWSRTGPAAVAVAVTALALIPITVALWPNLPMTARVVALPRWFTEVAPSLPPGTVVLPYPAALGDIQSSMAWQAEDDVSFSMVGGGGPGVVPSRAGKERPGFEVLARASVPLGVPPQATPANLAAIRQALAGWGVTTIVVPDQPELPSYDRGRPVPYAVGLFTAALGRAPVHQAGAWVWSHVAAAAGSPVTLSSAAFDACVTSSAAARSAHQAATCVLAAR